MDDDLDIYGDDGLGGAGLGADDSFLLGEDSAPSSASRNRRVSQASAYSDVVDYGADEPQPVKLEQPKTSPSSAIASVPPALKSGPRGPLGTPPSTSGAPGTGPAPPPANLPPPPSLSGTVRERPVPASLPSKPAPSIAQPPPGVGGWGGLQAPAHASRSLFVEDLSWWTTDEDMQLAIAEAGLTEFLIPSEIAFSEHRVNGKSKGVCFLPFSTSDACLKAKDFFEEIEIHGRKPSVKFVQAGQQHNPFRTLPKDPKELRMEAAMKRTVPAGATPAPLPSASQTAPPPTAIPPSFSLPPTPTNVPRPVPASQSRPQLPPPPSTSRAQPLPQPQQAPYPGFSRGPLIPQPAPYLTQPPSNQPPPQSPYDQDYFSQGPGAPLPPHSMMAFARPGTGGRPGPPRDPAGGYPAPFYERGFHGGPYPPPGSYFDGPDEFVDYGAFGRGPGGPGGRFPPRPFPGPRLIDDRDPRDRFGPDGGPPFGPNGANRPGWTGRSAPPATTADADAGEHTDDIKIKREPGLPAAPTGEKRKRIGEEADAQHLGEADHDIKRYAGPNGNRIMMPPPSQAPSSGGGSGGGMMLPPGLDRFGNYRGSRDWDRGRRLGGGGGVSVEVVERGSRPAAERDWERRDRDKERDRERDRDRDRRPAQISTSGVGAGSRRDSTASLALPATPPPASARSRSRSRSPLRRSRSRSRSRTRSRTRSRSPRPRSRTRSRTPRSRSGSRSRTSRSRSPIPLQQISPVTTTAQPPDRGRGLVHAPAHARVRRIALAIVGAASPRAGRRTLPRTAQELASALGEEEAQEFELAKLEASGRLKGAPACGKSTGSITATTTTFACAPRLNALSVASSALPSNVDSRALHDSIFAFGVAMRAHLRGFASLAASADRPVPLPSTCTNGPQPPAAWALDLTAVCSPHLLHAYTPKSRHSFQRRRGSRVWSRLDSACASSAPTWWKTTSIFTGTTTTSTGIARVRRVRTGVCRALPSNFDIRALYNTRNDFHVAMRGLLCEFASLAGFADWTEPLPRARTDGPSPLAAWVHNLTAVCTPYLLGTRVHAWVPGCRRHPTRGRGGRYSSCVERGAKLPTVHTLSPQPTTTQLHKSTPICRQLVPPSNLSSSRAHATHSLASIPSAATRSYDSTSLPPIWPALLLALIGGIENLLQIPFTPLPALSLSWPSSAPCTFVVVAAGFEH
ncbi:hypothetical protein BDK51DRAFT_45611 [Blyttiomyces helicus]|uniref:RRM domain-containing protein n=1 Tax=Blyttiomyces helicus TaxID=388810 RepID=A0A4P9WFG9_9FUNG|nr:hypothetical protein BDK51DRAFT_45611 [Blyttiomyces helicus]|eukprot:RKO91499.1 hypothetical protein BDK51DRAFT_45611 [Blyttiomyces helicus]